MIHIHQILLQLKDLKCSVFPYLAMLTVRYHSQLWLYVLDDRM